MATPRQIRRNRADGELHECAQVDVRSAAALSCALACDASSRSSICRVIWPTWRSMRIRAPSMPLVTDRKSQQSRGIAHHAQRIAQLVRDRRRSHRRAHRRGARATQCWHTIRRREARCCDELAVSVGGMNILANNDIRGHPRRSFFEVRTERQATACHTGSDGEQQDNGPQSSRPRIRRRHQRMLGPNARARRSERISQYQVPIEFSQRISGNLRALYACGLCVIEHSATRFSQANER